MVKLRTALKNQVNNLCSAHGVNLNKESLASEKGLKAVLEMHFDLRVNLELKITIDQIRSLNKSIAELEETIEGQSWKGIRISPASRGSAGSTAVSCFRSSAISATLRTRASWRPTLSSFRVSNSNATERSGRITKRGTKLGRTRLIQCALLAPRFSRYRKTYYERMKSRRGPGKAIVALARKFLGIIYRTLKNKWVFEDFPNFVLAEEAAA